ncbi:MAG: MBOAT family protein [Roseivirga sp.]
MRAQNLFLVIASYVFYGWWDWRFLFLIFASSAIDFLIGKKLGASTNERHRKTLMWTSVLINLGILCAFKYFGFFVDSFSILLDSVGFQVNPFTLEVILPVGISFYTFQTMSYSIDIYKRRMQPDHDYVAFFAFVSFFPQLVAGPIERARNLLPQMHVQRQFEFDKAIDATKQILWGFFKKMVVADNCANIVNEIYGASESLNSTTLLMGAFFFSFQMYGDFSGYSDIAIGLARLFGFKLSRNFAYPLFAKSFPEFWRRWHITLTNWFRDYVYIPMTLANRSAIGKLRNTIVLFVLIGFWHGANLTFVIWGVLNACLFIPSLFSDFFKGTHVRYQKKPLGLPYPGEFIRMIFVFTISTLGLILFRSEDIFGAINYYQGLLNFTDYGGIKINSYALITTTGFVVILQGVEWIGRFSEIPLKYLLDKRPAFVQLLFYYLLLMFIFFFAGKSQEYIYFQF